MVVEMRLLFSLRWQYLGCTTDIKGQAPCLVEPFLDWKIPAAVGIRVWGVTHGEDFFATSGQERVSRFGLARRVSQRSILERAAAMDRAAKVGMIWPVSVGSQMVLPAGAGKKFHFDALGRLGNPQQRLTERLFLSH